MFGEVGGDSGVQHDDLGPGVIRQHVDSGATAQEIHHHGRGDVLRVGADTFGHHTVVSGGQYHGLAADAGCGFAEDPG